MIAYKVVDKKTRRGSNYALITNNNFQEVNIDVSPLEKYYPKYLKGERTRYIPGSVGIMCFETREQAREFISIYSMSNYAIIIMVEGHHRLELSPIYPMCGKNLKVLKESMDSTADYKIYTVFNPPTGTLMFKSVVPLE